MRRTGSQREEWVALLAGSVGALWRWRLELVLVAVALAAWRLLARPLGPLAAAVIVGATVAAVLLSPAARGALVRWLRAARVRRRWRRAWIDVGLPPVAARRVWPVPAGELVRISCARGSSIPAVAARAEQLAACLGAREVRVSRDPRHAARGMALLVRRDPLDTASVEWPLAGAAGPLCLWNPVPVGVDEYGRIVSVSLPERNLLMGGEPGAGKSAALSLLLAGAAMDASVRLWLLDAKRVELAAWEPCAQRAAGPDVEHAIALLDQLQAVMEARYRDLLDRGARKIAPG